MKRILSRYALLLGALVLFLSNTQAQNLNDADVPIDVQKWFYSKYPGASEISWSAIKSKSGEDLFQAEFPFDSDDIEAIFSANGKLLYENREFHKSKSPAPIIDHASSNFGKFKLLAIHKHTNFDYGALHSQETNYELIMKVGKEVMTVWFNKDMNRHDQFETSNLAIK